MFLSLCLIRILCEAPVSCKFVQFISRKNEEKSLKSPLDMSIKRIALAGTSSSEEYHSCQLRQNLSVAPFSSSLLDKTIFMARPNLTLQLSQKSNSAT